MQLPAPQLSEALSMCQELRDPLREHLLSFTEGQRAHIPQSTQEVVLGTPKETTSIDVPPTEKEKVTDNCFFKIISIQIFILTVRYQKNFH